MTNYNILLQNIALKLIASSYRMKGPVNVQRKGKQQQKRIFNSGLLKREFYIFFFIHLTHSNGRTDHNSDDKFTHIKRLLGHGMSLMSMLCVVSCR